MNLSALYRKYSPSIYFVCLKYTRNAEDAEDLVHQVFIKVQMHLGEFRGESGIYTWMYRIAVNECIELHRKRRSDRDGGGDPSLWESLSFAPEAEWDAKLVLEKITRLSDPKTMEILFLIHLEGLQQEDVAKIMNVSRATVNRRVAAFREKLARSGW